MEIDPLHDSLALLQIQACESKCGKMTLRIDYHTVLPHGDDGHMIIVYSYYNINRNLTQESRAPITCLYKKLRSFV